MPILIIIFVISILFPTNSMSAIPLSDMYDSQVDTRTITDSRNFPDAITRDNTCSIEVDGLVLSQSRANAFYADMKIVLNTYSIGGITPDKTKILRVVFKDVIKITSKDAPFSIKSGNKKLVDNLPLSDVTDIDITVSLIPIKDVNSDKYKMITPLLNQLIPAANPAFDVITNFINQERSSEEQSESYNNIVFQANFKVPQSFLEYKKNKGKGAAIIENNQILGIVMSGQNAVPLSSSIAGDAGTFINSVTKFIVGKEIVKKDNVYYDGVLKLSFTKDSNPIIPKDLQTSLSDICYIIEYDPSPVSVYQMKMQDLLNDSKNAKAVGQINKNIFFNIKSFLDLGRIYLSFRQNLINNDGNNADWKRDFRTFVNKIEMTGVDSGIESIGIKGIYSNTKYAKIYLPYSLPDEYANLFSFWQTELHGYLSSTNDILLAKDIPSDFLSSDDGSTKLPPEAHLSSLIH